MAIYSRARELAERYGFALVFPCGCCDSYHRLDYHGDCRNDAERFADLDDAYNRLGCPVVEVEEATGEFGPPW